VDAAEAAVAEDDDDLAALGALGTQRGVGWSWRETDPRITAGCRRRRAGAP
jgi:hypothetical protein